MKDEIRVFLGEGLKRYKEAMNVMKEFLEYTQIELQEILIKRNNWGSSFKPKETIKPKSTKYWVVWPLANAQTEGTIRGEAARIQISINWYKSKKEYPFYEIWLYDGPESTKEKIGAYKKRGRFELLENARGIKMDPNPEDFNLERDFNLLIDEFVKIL